MSQSREIITYSKQTLGLLLCLLAGAVAYVYFLNMSVVHVVIQKDTISEIQDTKNAIALLESEYITAQHLIANRMASIEGVVAERNKVFVWRGEGEELAANQ